MLDHINHPFHHHDKNDQGYYPLYLYGKYTDKLFINSDQLVKYNHNNKKISKLAQSKSINNYQDKNYACTTRSDLILKGSAV